MTAQIWTPAPPKVDSVPSGDVLLSCGILLRYIGPFPNEAFLANAKRQGLPEADIEAFRLYAKGGEWISGSFFKVIASVEQTPNHGTLLHCSMSYPRRDPSWAEIKAVRDAFYPPTVDVMMMLPQASDYINWHDHCFHIWQTPTEWGLQ